MSLFLNEYHPDEQSMSLSSESRARSSAPKQQVSIASPLQRLQEENVSSSDPDLRL